MKQLIFPSEVYVQKLINEEAVKIAGVSPKYVLVCQNELKCGLFELLDIILSKLSEKKLDKKGHKTNKKLRTKLKEISRYKDADEDARILKELSQTLLLEDAEYELLKEHIDSGVQKVTPRMSELVSDLYDLIDNAQDWKPPLAIVDEKE